MFAKSAAVFFVTLAVPVLSGQAMFEGAAGFGEEELKGHPKSVRVEPEKLSGDPVRVLEEESGFREDGKLESTNHFTNGDLADSLAFLYDAKGHRSTIIPSDADRELPIAYSEMPHPQDSTLRS